jgi:hypothetical protein
VNQFGDVVKNLELYVDCRLSWRKQFLAAFPLCVCFIVFRDVRSLIVPIFLYSDSVYFPSLTGAGYFFCIRFQEILIKFSLSGFSLWKIY